MLVAVGADLGARPDDQRRTAFIAVAALFIVAGLVTVVVAVTRGTAEPPPSLTAATGPAATRPLTRADLDGQWTVAPDGQSFVGYRIDEKLLRVATPNSVTGRTSAVQAGMVVRNASIVAGGVDGDLRQLHSDDPDRDEAMRTKGLQTDTFPRAIFTVTEGPDLTTVPPAGTEMTYPMKGDLTIHGVTKPIELQVKAQTLAAATPMIEVIGSKEIALRDYGIEPPTVAGVLEAADHGDLEFKIRLVHT